MTVLFSSTAGSVSMSELGASGLEAVLRGGARERATPGLAPSS
jgi:hypothetical protein